jgi:cAMP phosphodiesterase
MKSTKVLNPIVVKCKGKAPFKRNVSTIEKIVTQAKKKTSDNNANKKRKNQVAYFSSFYECSLILTEYMITHKHFKHIITHLVSF